MKSFPQKLEKVILFIWTIHILVFLGVEVAFLPLPSFPSWLYAILVQIGKCLRAADIEGTLFKKNDLPSDVTVKKVVLLISDILRPVLWIWTSVEVAMERYEYSTFVLILFFATTGMDILFYVIGQFLTVRAKEQRIGEEPER